MRKAVPIPIQVRFDTLEEERRPASGDPSFVGAWGWAPADDRPPIERRIRR